MHTEDSDYLLMSLPYHPVHDLKKHFISEDEKALLYLPAQVAFKQHLAQHEPSYPRYVLDYKANNKELVPIFVSPLILREERRMVLAITIPFSTCSQNGKISTIWALCSTTSALRQ